MTQTVHGYAARDTGGHLSPFSFERRDLREDDVQIDILYCGVCHSDLHQARNDWGWSNYPLVPGHEIIGRVRQVGAKVSKFKAGDLVGVGCMVDSCGHCHACTHHLEQYCEEGMTQTYNTPDRRDQMMTYGGYSEQITVTENFVLRIPENLNTQAVAPLLCAGITVWSPLRHWNIGKDSKVAVVGLGGLGHMAIKLARALGAEVTLFTRSPSKAEDAFRLGTHQVVLSNEETQMNTVANQFNLIIDTVPYTHDLKPYLPTLALDGTLVMVGLVGELEESINTVLMQPGRRSIAASMIGGIQETQEMLDFCGKHNIVSDVEVINMQEINDAFVRMEKSEVKYRFVIDMASLKNA